MSAADVEFVVDAKPAVPLIAVESSLWGGPRPECVDAELWDRLSTAWRLSVHEANEEIAVRTYYDRMRRAYMAYVIRLRALAVSLHADRKLAELRDALVEKTQINRENRSDTHRGPYVPGGSYTDHWLEPSLRDEQIVLDLRDYDDDCLIPRVVTATVDYCEVTYTLESIAECGPKWARTLVATYSVSLG